MLQPIHKPIESTRRSRFGQRTCFKFVARFATRIASLALIGAVANAGDNDAAKSIVIDETPQEQNAYDWLWSIPTIIDNPDAPYIQKLAITGRYHGQIYALDSDQGSDQDHETRRWYMGVDTSFLEKFRINAYAVLDGNDFNPLYDHFYEAYASYKHGDNLSVSFGRREPHFTQEFTSSKHIITFERSLLINQVHPENLAGLWFNGKIGGSAFGYDLAFYSGDLDNELGSFDAGYVYDLDLSYDFAENSDAEKSLLRFGYLLNDGDERNNAPRPYEHAFSLNYLGDYGKFGVRSDLLYATGLGETPDVWGLVLTPTYAITNKLEGVFRYQWANSNGDNGLNLQKHYERAAPGLLSTYGDEYHAFYAGLNYYIYGPKLKLMTGVEYSTMHDAANDGGNFNGWTWFGGLRMYF